MNYSTNDESGKVFDLKNRVVVITGGAGLLGQAFSKAIASKGGRPVIADIRIKVAGEVASRINEELGTGLVSTVEIDITSKVSVQKAIHDLCSKFGQIDALVNNAYPRNKNYGRKFEEVEYSDFCENLNLHLGGYFLTSQQFAQYFKEQGHGNIITISSIYGVMAPRFEIYEDTQMTMPVEYAAVKSALVNLNEYLLKYYKGCGIRFNCLSPGGIIDEQSELFINKYKEHSQTKGMLEPIDVAGTLVFLLSDHSSYINGQNIIVDDGWSI